LTPQEGAGSIKAKARELGFAAAGIADLGPIPHADQLDRWLDQGLAGTMRYMHRQAARRKAPESIMPGAKVCVVVMYNYGHDDPEAVSSAGRVARFARGADYHRALIPALEALASHIEAVGGPGTTTRAFVDAGPVPERELAQRAGLGWIGKNTLLIRPGLGSYTFIATVFTNANLSVDPPFTTDRCGTCTRCLTACPTDAFPDPRVLDARRCISYLTIEHRGEIAGDLAKQVGPWVFGCDICQDVCPWNRKFASEGPTSLVALDPARAWIPFGTFATLDEAAFDRQYGWTPLERPGLEGMRRNMAIAERNAAEAPS